MGLQLELNIFESMKLNEIQDLIKFVAKSGVSQVELGNGWNLKLVPLKQVEPKEKGQKQAAAAATAMHQPRNACRSTCRLLLSRGTSTGTRTSCRNCCSKRLKLRLMTVSM